MNLCWWEYEELVEHLHERSDVWTQDPENPMLWVRSDLEGEAQLGLTILPPKSKDNPYRQYAVGVVPLAWDASTSDDYVASLLIKWTTYGVRLRVMELFQDPDFGFTPDKAMLASIAVAKILQEPDPDPERLEITTQRELWPDLQRPPERLFTDRTEMHFDVSNYLEGRGGWMKLSKHGGMLRIRMNLPDFYHYSLRLDGFVRPTTGTVEDVATRLFARQEEQHGKQSEFGRTEDQVCLPQSLGEPGESDGRAQDELPEPGDVRQRGDAGGPGAEPGVDEPGTGSVLG